MEMTAAEWRWACTFLLVCAARWRLLLLLLLLLHFFSNCLLAPSDLPINILVRVLPRFESFFVSHSQPSSQGLFSFFLSLSLSIYMFIFFSISCILCWKWKIPAFSRFFLCVWSYRRNHPHFFFFLWEEFCCTLHTFGLCFRIRNCLGTMEL